jgi:hypothetical protein
MTSRVPPGAARAAVLALAALCVPHAAWGAASDAALRIRGAVSAVDRNVEPPTLTVTDNGAARTISVNSDARIVLEDVAVSGQVKGTLEDVRPGDAVLVTLAKDGRVLEIDDFFRSTTGTVRAVSSTSVVLANGTVLTPPGTAEIFVNDAVARVADLQPGDAVTVRRNPDTGEVRAVIATRKTAATPPASSVRITSITISATHALHAGQSFDVRLDGTPGGTATFDIGNLVTDNAMREEAPGQYRARFTIPDRFNVTGVSVYGHLIVGGTRAARAEAPTQLSAATTPPAIVDVAPPSGESVNTPRPNIYATFVSPSDVGIDATSIRVVVNGRDVTAQSTRSAGFVTYSPPSDYANGTVTVTVRVADAAGNDASRSWSFTVAAAKGAE